MSNWLSLKNVHERSSETRLLLEGARLLLHCTTNIMDASSRRLLIGSLSGNFDKGEEVFYMFLNSSELYYNQLISQNFKDENFNRANVTKGISRRGNFTPTY